MEKKTFKVKVPKVGSKQFDHEFNEHIVTEDEQREMVDKIILSWKHTIECPFVISCIKDDNKPFHMIHQLEPNPYYGWTMDQLEIISI